LRGSEGPAEAGAFQRRRRGSKPQRRAQILFLGDRQRERAMEDVACAERIHRVYREGRRLLQMMMLVEPYRALRAARARQEGRGQLRDLVERLAIVGDVGGFLQGLTGENQVRRRREQAFP
jgi:hypothetical protein